MRLSVSSASLYVDYFSFLKIFHLQVQVLMTRFPSASFRFSTSKGVLLSRMQKVKAQKRSMQAEMSLQ